MKTALATVNMDLTNVNQITYSVKTGSDIVAVPVAQAQTIQAVEAAYLSTPPKITETKAVTQTVRDDVLIEIEVIAIK
jgi:2-iminobutanoate/2-iminopropanoate deaminase